MTTPSELDTFNRLRSELKAMAKRLNVPMDVEILDCTSYLWGIRERSSWRVTYYTENKFEAEVFAVDSSNFELEINGDFVFVRGDDCDEREEGVPTILIFRLVNRVTEEALANMIRDYEK